MVPLSTDVQRYIKESFWPYSSPSVVEYESYFMYFQWTISTMSWPKGPLDKQRFAAQTYIDIAKIVQTLRARMDDSHVDVALELQKDFPNSSQAQILRSMDLVARLWLTLHIESEDFPIGPTLSNVTPTLWSNAVSLKDSIRNVFEPTSYPAQFHTVGIDPSFTVYNLHKLCRLEIKWTANLRDHLKFDRATSTLYLFCHKVCLISHMEFSDIFPKGFIPETIRTLDLLFPFGKASTQKYLDETGQSFYRTTSPNLSRPMDFGEFHYWQKRLIELHDVYNEAPKSVLQMWYDRRNPIQWWTFWLAAAIAILTIVFGTIASYTGFKQASLAQKSFDLALSQACSQENPLKLCGT